ncbi:MAG: hypothetical protein M5U19_12825 [Microthrixaceae bacterium]|nr:hypothetical protein [Microthrixaceae bacterium]
MILFGNGPPWYSLTQIARFVTCVNALPVTVPGDHRVRGVELRHVHR